MRRRRPPGSRLIRRTKLPKARRRASGMRQELSRSSVSQIAPCNELSAVKQHEKPADGIRAPSAFVTLPFRCLFLQTGLLTRERTQSQATVNARQAIVTLGRIRIEPDALLHLRARLCPLLRPFQRLSKLAPCDRLVRCESHGSSRSRCRISASRGVATVCATRSSSAAQCIRALARLDARPRTRKFVRYVWLGSSGILQRNLTQIARGQLVIGIELCRCEQSRIESGERSTRK